MQKPLGMTNFAPVKVANSFFTTQKTKLRKDNNDLILH